MKWKEIRNKVHNYIYVHVNKCSLAICCFYRLEYICVHCYTVDDIIILRTLYV